MVTCGACIVGSYSSFFATIAFEGDLGVVVVEVMFMFMFMFMVVEIGNENLIVFHGGWVERKYRFRMLDDFFIDVKSWICICVPLKA